MGSDIREETVKTEDKTAPNATITFSNTSVIEGENITAIVEQTDSESGVKAAGSKWIYNTTEGEIGTNAADYTGGTFSSNTQTITLSNATGRGTYYLHVLTVDNAGNVKEIISSAVTVTPEWSAPYTSTVKDNYTDSTGKKATIPEGFQVSLRAESNKIDEGLVVRGPDQSEFVWIPVPDVNEMYEIQNGNKVGKLYNFSGNTFTQIVYSATGYREPDAVSADTPNIVSMEIEGVTSNMDFKNHLSEEFDNMIDSVGRYNGFYIGRYETGDLSKTKVVSKKDNTDIVRQGWWTCYKLQREMYEDVDSVTSGMIYGCQWDATVRWTIATNRVHRRGTKQQCI